MRQLLSFLKGLSLGLGGMYLFDPALGRKRRLMLLDQAEAQGRRCQEFVGRGVRDLANRGYGMAAELWAKFRKDSAPADVVARRVRTIMGRHVSHPRAIDVAVDEERIVLRGAILAREVQPFLQAVESVRGMMHVENQLDVHEKADTPDLMAEGRHHRSDSANAGNWPAGAKFLAAAGVLGLTACLARNRATRMALLGGLGLGVMSASRETAGKWSVRRSRSAQPKSSPESDETDDVSSRATVGTYSNI